MAAMSITGQVYYYLCEQHPSVQDRFLTVDVQERMSWISVTQVSAALSGLEQRKLGVTGVGHFINMTSHGGARGMVWEFIPPSEDAPKPMFRSARQGTTRNRRIGLTHERRKLPLLHRGGESQDGNSLVGRLKEIASALVDLAIELESIGLDSLSEIELHRELKRRR